MPIRVDVYHHIAADSRLDDILERLTTMAETAVETLARVQRIEGKEASIEATLAAQSQLIKDLKAAAGDPAAQQAIVDELIKLEAGQDAAIAANPAP